MDLRNFGHGGLKIFYMYNSDTIFRRMRDFGPASARFWISGRKKFAYVQTVCKFCSFAVPAKFPIRRGSRKIS